MGDQRGKNVTWMWKRICAIYEVGTANDWTCQKWLAKFCAGDFSMNDVPWLGRTVQINCKSNEEILRLINEDRQDI